MTESQFNFIVLGWIIIALFAFIGSLIKTAPYGRHTSTTWGPLIANRLGWVLMEFPSLLLCPLLYFLFIDTINLSLFFVILWSLHYTHRTFIFPFLLQTKGKKMPITIVLMALVFNTVNASLNGYWLALYADYSIQYFTSLPFIGGLLLFFVGMGINCKSDYALIRLRKRNGKGYVIPKGGLFNYISCPNHFGEILEWLGFAIAVGSFPAWSFFIWTAANTIPRAISHHKWYKSTFKEYPQNRKAVIPFLV